MIHSILALSLGIAAFPAIAVPAPSPVAGKDTALVRLVDLAWEDFQEDQVLVAGEKVSTRWSRKDSLVRPRILIQGPDSAWLVARKGDPEVVRTPRKTWRLPVDVEGPRRVRVEDAETGRHLRTFRAVFLPPAGSLRTGPFLYKPLRDSAFEARLGRPWKPVPSAKEYSGINFEVFRASGGPKSLPDYLALQRRAVDDMLNQPRSAGLPVLVSRLRFHYWDPSGRRVQEGRFDGAGFLKDTLETNKVVFLLKEDYHFTNLEDSLIAVGLRIGRDSLALTPGQGAPHAFRSAGDHDVRLTVETAKARFTSSARVHVRRMWTREEETLARKTSGHLADPPGIGFFSEVRLRSPSEIDSLTALENP